MNKILLKTEEELFVELIEESRKELMKSKMNERYWSMESVDPRKAGKQDAMDKLALWQKHIQTVENQINIFKSYLKENYNCDVEERT